jgi:hypothetical protein
VAVVVGCDGDVVDVFGTIVAEREVLSGAVVSEQAVAEYVVDIKIVNLEMDAVTVAAPCHLDACVVVHQLETLHFRRFPCETAEGENHQDTQKYMFFHYLLYSFAKLLPTTILVKLLYEKYFFAKWHISSVETFLISER